MTFSCFEEVLTQNRKALVMFLVSLGCAYVDAEDLVQKASLAVYARNPILDPLKPERPQILKYLFTAAKYAYFSFRRSPRSKTTNDDFLLECATASQETVEDHLIRQTELELALASLSPNERAIVELRFVEGLSAADTAQQLNGSTEAAVNTTVFRVRAKLRPLLNRQLRTRKELLSAE